MIKLIEITDEYRQQHIVPLDGTDMPLYLTLEFKTNLNCWFFSIAYGTFVSNNEQLMAGGNLLRQYQNVLPFGISVVTNNLLDPVTLDAFATGVAVLYVMTATEVQELETMLYG